MQCESVENKSARDVFLYMCTCMHGQNSSGIFCNCFCICMGVLSHQYSQTDNELVCVYINKVCLCGVDWFMLFYVPIAFVCVTSSRTIITSNAMD